MLRKITHLFVLTHVAKIDNKYILVLSIYMYIYLHGRQKGPNMMTRYARSYSLQKGRSLEYSVE